MPFEESQLHPFVVSCLDSKSIDENCFLVNFQTKLFHIEGLTKALSSISSEDSLLSISWLIEVADEYNGWFPAIALGYQVSLHQLLIKVYNNPNDCFEGLIPIDHRVVRILECQDTSSIPLFNKLIRDSIQTIRWEVDWLDYNPKALVSNSKESSMKWIRSMAKYYVCMQNVLLVEDYLPVSPLDERKGLAQVFVAKNNLRLNKCFKQEGYEEFERLILEEHIRCHSYARAQIKFMNNQYFPRNKPPPQSLKSDSIDDELTTISSKSTTSSNFSNCVICLTNPITNIALIPCGHQILCHSCFQVFFKGAKACSHDRLLQSIESYSNNHHHNLTNHLDRMGSNDDSSPEISSTSSQLSSASYQLTPLTCPLCRSHIYNTLTIYQA